MSNIEGKITFFDYLCMFSFLFLSGSFWIISKPGIVRLFLFLVLDIVVLITKRNFWVSRKEIIVVMLMLLSMIINLESIKTIVIYFILFFSALIFKQGFSLEKFTVLYTKTITVVSLMSIVLWIIAYAFPSLVLNFPLLTNFENVSVWNAIIAVQMPSSIRVQGFFWEPGAFQAFAGFAIIFLLFKKDIDIPIKNIRNMLLVNIIAVGLTFSSTAYIAMACIFALAFTTRKYKAMGDTTKKKLNLILAISVVIVIVILNLPARYQYLIWGKFQAYKVGADANTVSVSTRVDSMKAAWTSFISSPIWGNGESKLLAYMENNYGHKNTMFTYLNMFALFGIVVGMFLCKSLYDFFAKVNTNKFVVFSLFVIVGIMTFSENFIIVSVFLSLIFYGMDAKEYVETDL